MGDHEFWEWVRYARDDLEVAQLLMALKPRKIEIICYHCQQAAEKYLKALLAKVDAPIPRTHALLTLVEVAVADSEAKRNLGPSLARLEPYAIAVRYPFQLEIAEGAEERVLSAAEVVAKYVEELPNHPEYETQ